MLQGCDLVQEQFKSSALVLALIPALVWSQSWDGVLDSKPPGEAIHPTAAAQPLPHLEIQADQ